MLKTEQKVFINNGYPSVGRIIRDLRIRHLFLLDFLFICLAVFLAILLKLENFDGTWDYIKHDGWILFIIAPIVRLPLYALFKLYNRLWRYAGSEELHGILRAGITAPFGIAFINFVLLPTMGAPYSHSRSVWFLEAILSLCMLAGLRFTLRFWEQRKRRGQPPKENLPSLPTLIIGAGDAGAMILREIKRNPQLGVEIVGFVDDDANKLHNMLLGVPVLGTCEDLRLLIQKHDIQQIIIAMPTAPGKIIRQVVQTCEALGIRPRIVPRLDTLVNETNLLNHLRAVEIEDLLRRAPIVTDIQAVSEQLQGKRVLVTGGGGSIGSELCRQILRCHPAQLIIIGHGENSVFEIEQELGQTQKRDNTQTNVTTYIADIRMEERILAIFQQCQPEIVFHAAAHKHVPLMEANPSEAVTNNILGTRNVLQAAQAVDVSHFIMISTDKAVNPTNVMGASKRSAELLVLDTARRTGKSYVAVRFGNVLGSRGSVVHTFKRQIATGGPITITDPNIRRFFMTIPEAVQLVLQAAVLGSGGEIFILDMGEPVRIIDLATDLARLSGLEVGRDIDIISTGLRPGEKLYEELFLPGEIYQTTSHSKIRVAASAASFVPEHLHASIAKLEQAVEQADDKSLLKQLHVLVPEYHKQLPPVNEPTQQPQHQEVILQNLVLGSAD